MCVCAFLCVCVYACVCVRACMCTVRTFDAYTSYQEARASTECPMWIAGLLHMTPCRSAWRTETLLTAFYTRLVGKERCKGWRVGMDNNCRTKSIESYEPASGYRLAQRDGPCVRMHIASCTSVTIYSLTVVPTLALVAWPHRRVGSLRYVTYRDCSTVRTWPVVLALMALSRLQAHVRL